MIKEKISSQEIIDLVASKASVSKRAAEDFLKVMIASIEEALVAGDVVKIKNFGTFKLQWNEPRKSVNIQTGEEIKLTGFYKVSFTPDIILKTQVNEPFAHLEPVVLDSELTRNNQEETSETGDVDLDPLKIFTEQVSEIKNLIFEIQSLSKNSPVTVSDSELNIEPESEEEEVPEEEQVQEPVYTQKQSEVSETEIYAFQEEKPAIENLRANEKKEAIIQQEEVLSNSDHVTVLKPANYEDIADEEKVQDITPEITKISDLTENAEEDSFNHLRKEEPVLYSELQATPYLENIKSPRKKKVWLWILLIFVLVSGTATGLYLFYSPTSEFSNKTIPNFKKSANKEMENLSVTEMINSISKWFKPAAKAPVKAVTVVIPKETNDFDTVSLSQDKGLDQGIEDHNQGIEAHNQGTDSRNPGTAHNQSVVSPNQGPVSHTQNTTVSSKLPINHNQSAKSHIQRIDSLKLLFDNPRVYKEYIASERISEGNRLTLMSKRYYGTKDFWVYIYEANKNEIPNPDHIAIGTLIKIPKVDSRLIDATNPRCLEKARELHDLYVK